MKERKIIDINEVVADLKSGMGRYKKDDIGFGSIQEKYKLSRSEMKIVCSHPKLKNKKIKIPVDIEVVDSSDVNSNVNEESTEVITDNWRDK